MRIVAITSIQSNEVDLASQGINETQVEILQCQNPTCSDCANYKLRISIIGYTRFFATAAFA